MIRRDELVALQARFCSALAASSGPEVARAVCHEIHEHLDTAGLDDRDLVGGVFGGDFPQRPRGPKLAFCRVVQRYEPHERADAAGVGDLNYSRALELMRI